MNNNFYIPLIALCATLSLTLFASTTFQDATDADSSIGQRWAKEFVRAYNEGMFEERLDSIDDGVKKGTEEDVFDKYKTSITEYANKSENQVRTEIYLQRINQLIEECKEDLKEVLNAYPNSEISKSVKVYIEIHYFLEKDSAWQKVEDILNDKDNILYTQFSEIANRKHLRLLAITYLEKDVKEDNESKKNQYETDFALIRYEELIEALKVAQIHADESLISLINQAMNECIEFHGKLHDASYVHLLGSEGASPKDEAEKQVAEIMSNYQAKHKALTDECLENFPTITE